MLIGVLSKTDINGDRMPTSNSTSISTVVDLSGFRTPARRKHYRSNGAVLQADMLSMRRYLAYQASVEIDKLDWMKQEFGDTVPALVEKKVRALLNMEFGKLRVHRYRRLYVIRHRSVEGLISSLLRVQFHAHQLELPAFSKTGEVAQPKPVTLTWGVGRTTTEADVERLRRRRQKFKR